MQKPPSRYPVPADAARQARLDREGYAAAYRRSLEENDAFWAEQAEALIDWHSGWTSVRKGDFHGQSPIEWFDGATLNVAANCLDRHLAERGDQAALIWEPASPDEAAVVLTYRDLHRRVVRFTSVLTAQGVKAGDVVTLYLPMILEAAIAMLACARIGAPHSVVFGGFSAEALRSRIDDGRSRIVITADEGMRGEKKTALKATVDIALEGSEVETVIVVRRTGGDIGWVDGRDRWWHALDAEASGDDPLAFFPASHPLFLLYTSGSTGKPKGLVHGSGGYLLYAALTFRTVFDHRPGEVYWCTADIGWITGHSYLIYGPLASGATTLMFEGVPTWPDPSRFWQVVERHRVAILYTAPTAIRLLMREGDDWVKGADRSSLRILGSVGEPIGPEAWRWYHEVVGHGRARIVDTWWQTETGGHMITPLPGVSDLKPGAAMQPFLGIEPALLVPGETEIVAGEGEGALCIARPWPGMARTIHGDHARFVETYFAAYPGYYFSGDAARRDADGDYWIAGRMDDVLNVSGHRIGTAEIESALGHHPAVAEAAVVGRPHEVKGEDIYAFVALKPGHCVEESLAGELKAWVRKEIGAHAAPGEIHFAPDLPKTRSGKIMRRILRKIAAGEIAGPEDYGKLGDISTLIDPSIVDALLKGQDAY